MNIKGVLHILLIQLCLANVVGVNAIYAQCSAVITSNLDPDIEGCEPLTVQFSSSLSGGVITSIIWYFGDGDSATSNNPTHTFYAGVSDTTYIVTLSLTCISGSSSATDTVTVFAPPSVAFLADTVSVCAISDSVCFTNLSDVGPGYSYNWDFGDFTISSDFEPCHIYTSDGTYSVELTVTSDKGCFRDCTIVDLMNVIAAPNPQFDILPLFGCHPQDIIFTNTTVDTASINSWTWNWGDGSPVDTNQNPGSHTFAAPDTFFVTLGAISSLGCANSSQRALIVFETPTSDFTASGPVCVDEDAVITYTGSAGSGATYVWDFDGGVAVPGTGQGPHLVQWGTDGMKNIVLTVIVDSCSSTFSSSVLVNTLPVVNLANTIIGGGVCNGGSVTFTASPFFFIDYEFFINGITAQSSSSFTFETNSLIDGDQVTVIVTDVNGCWNNISDTIIITVNPLPIVTLTSSTGNDTICEGSLITFTGLPATGAFYSYYNGYQLLQDSSINNYSSTVITTNDSLSVFMTDSFGCVSLESNIIVTTVFQELTIPQVNCGNTSLTTIKFTWDTVSNAIGYEVSIDGGSTFNPPSSGVTGTSHLITGLFPGDSITIRVHALGNSTCGNSNNSIAVTCYALDCNAITFDKGPDPTVCSGDVLTLTCSNLSPVSYSMIWDGQAATLDSTFTATFVSDTVISVVLVDSNQLVCPPTTKYFTVTVNPLPVVTLSSTIANDTICQGEPVTFTASPGGFDIYEFFVGFAQVQIGLNNEYVTDSLLDGQQVSVVTANLGCANVISNVISTTVIDPLEAPEVYCGATTTSTIIFLWDPISGASGYQVSVDNSLFITPSSGPMGLTHSLAGLNPGDSVTIVVQALGGFPCGNSGFSIPVVCYALNCSATTFTEPSDTTICNGQSITLSIQDVSPASYSVSWDGNPATTNVNYFITPNFDTTITISLIDSVQLNCPATTKYVNVTVNDIPIVSLTTSLSTDTICLGDSVVFTASPSSYDNYEFLTGYLSLQTGGVPLYATGSISDGDSIYVVATNLSCPSDASTAIHFTVMPPLAQPQVNCGTTTIDSINFIWDPIPGATGYNVSVGGAAFTVPSSGLMGLTHLLAGLSPGDTAAIEVIALGAAPCGNSIISSQVTCSAIPCNALTYTNGPDITVCQGDSSQAYITNINTSSYLVSWNGGLPGIDTSYFYFPSQNDTIFIAVADTLQPLCPSVTKYILASATPAPTIVLTASVDSICYGEPVTFQASPAGYDNYAFFTDLAFLHDSVYQIFTYSGLAPGDSMYVVTSNSGCTDTSSRVPVTVVLPPVVSITSSSVNDTICDGESVIFTADTLGLIQYLFYVDNVLVQDSVINTFSIDSLQNGQAVIGIGVGELGCTSDTTNVIITTVLPTVSVFLTASDSVICEGDSISFTASPSGMISYAFLNNGVLVQNSVANAYTTTGVSSTDSVWVVAINPNGCAAVSADTIATVVNQLPVPMIMASDTSLKMCAGDSITLSVFLDTLFNGSTVLWGTGDTDTVITVTPPNDQYYWVSASLNGCSAVDSINLIVDTVVPIAEAGPNVILCLGQEATQLSASGGVSYSWSPVIGLSDPLDANTEASPAITTTYYVTVTNIVCSSVDSVSVIDFCMGIGEIITPNNDGDNELLLIPGIEFFPDNTIGIFNRWGNEVFSTEGYHNKNNNWKGRSNSDKPLPDGTYFYILDLGIDMEPLSGFVMIHR